MYQSFTCPNPIMADYDISLIVRVGFSEMFQINGLALAGGLLPQSEHFGVFLHMLREA